MNAKQMGWTVGTRVYVVHDHDRRRHKEYAATVVKVGREWVTIQPDGTDSEWSQEKFHFETMRLHGGNYSSPGRAHLSEDDYRETLVLDREWSAMVRSLSYRPPKHLSLADVRKVAAILTPTPRPPAIVAASTERMKE